MGQTGHTGLIRLLLQETVSYINRCIIIFQVSYSQCLGVIGYSVLPLVITALILPIFKAFHFVALLLKVSIFLVLFKTWEHLPYNNPWK